MNRPPLLVRWRGRLADLSRIEELEDALTELTIARRGYVDLPFGEGGRRGAALQLEPGLAQINLFVSDDGSFSPRGESPDGWVSCDTAWATQDGRALLVECLEAVRDGFAPDLEIQDGSGVAAPRNPDVRRAVRAAFRSSEHRRATITESDVDRCEGTEAEWAAFHDENTRRTLGVQRALELRRVGGEHSLDDFVEAMCSEGVALAAQVKLDSEPQVERNLPVEVEIQEFEIPTREERHPLLNRSIDLTVSMMKWFDEGALDPTDTLVRGVLESGGGLSQVLGEDDTPYGIIVHQLKRARRGLEFAEAALPACRAPRPDDRTLDRISAEIRFFTEEVESRLADQRRRWKKARRSAG